jgi:intracellular sulfur oxidation DsrE/DsrF family protein
MFHTVAGRMVARRSEMSAEWKVRFAICIASVAIQAFTKLLLSFSDVTPSGMIKADRKGKASGLENLRPYHRMESMRKSNILS